MEKAIITFIIGFIIGGLFGVMFISILVLRRDEPKPSGQKYISMSSRSRILFGENDYEKGEPVI